MESSPTRGRCGVKDHARIDVAHDGELRQHVGRAIDVGAHIHHHHRSAFEGGEGRGQSRPIHAGEHALHQFGRRHHGAGVAGRNEAVRDAVPHQASGHPDGAVALVAHRFRDAVVHGDVFAGVMHFDRQIG